MRLPNRAHDDQRLRLLGNNGSPRSVSTFRYARLTDEAFRFPVRSSAAEAALIERRLRANSRAVRSPFSRCVIRILALPLGPAPKGGALQTP
ncbi:hypothetical protein NDU88_005562 [Pleurodeles waltl]|uniref:Uncharacterized protein n=1 Tax=Pleurodeles waltl TaxID=8319 RepID=A0AAV7SLZ9_PLEWA|nr:hypothetical protein NDU88_005562 [Pleurodeles waltl]